MLYDYSTNQVSWYLEMLVDIKDPLFDCYLNKQSATEGNNTINEELPPNFYSL